jgi:hypothetical protein
MTGDLRAQLRAVIAGVVDVPGGTFLGARPSTNICRQLHNRTALTANGGADALRQRHRDLGIDIGSDTIVGNYCGDRLDLPYAVSVLTRQNVPAGTHASN